MKVERLDFDPKDHSPTCNAVLLADKFKCNCAGKGKMTDDELQSRFREVTDRLYVIDERLNGIENKLDQQMTALQDRLTEQMRDMQTELLKVFIPAKEEESMRHSIMEKRMASIEDRQGIISARLGEIEKKLLLNPPEGKL